MLILGSMRTKLTTKGPMAPLRARKTAQQPQVLAAPGMLERQVTLTREKDESDARYQSQCDLFDILLETARKHR